MKKHLIQGLILSGIFLFGSTLLAQTLDVRNTANYHPNGGLKSKAEYYYDSWSEQEVRHGRYAEWNAKGSLSYEAFYVHGKLMGKSVSYYDEGAPKAIEHWANGRLNGKCSYFYPNGTIKLEAHYLNGLHDGLWRHYRRDGSLKQLRRYEQGRLLEDQKIPKAPAQMDSSKQTDSSKEEKAQDTDSP